MKLFPAKDATALKKLLACAVDQDEVLSLNSLHGFLFCLATIPEPVHPSEWLPCVFGEEMIEVADEQEGKRLLAPLFMAYNRMVAESNQGELFFPFDMGNVRSADLERIRHWCYGFFTGTNLRPEVWGLPDIEEDLPEDAESDAEATEDEEEIAACMGVLMAVAFPERIPELLEDTPSGTEEALQQADEMEAKFFTLLPKAIQTLQEVARDYGRAKISPRPMGKVLHMPVRREEKKVGRNDPCPCGSGKKHKKCCGGN